MKTNMDVRSLGERDSNYTNSSVRQMKQKDSSKGRSKSSESGGGMITGLLAGAGVGVLAGMLLAPKTGKDFRKQVTDSATKLGTQANGLFNSSRDKVSSWTGKGKGNTTSNLNTTPRVDSTPNTNITPNRDLNNDPASTITM